MGSLLDGFPRPQEIVDRVAELGQTAVAITDHGSMATSLQFDQYAQEKGIKPILGVEAYLCDDISIRDKDADIYHIGLLAKNNEGLKNLFALSDIAWNKGFYKKPRIDFESLKDHHEGLFLLSGCMQGPLAKGHQFWARQLENLFKEDFVVEMQPWNPKELNQKLYEISEKYGLMRIATADTHYCTQADRAAEEINLLIPQASHLKGSEKDLIETKFGESRRIFDIVERLNYLYPQRKLRFDEIDVYLMSKESLQKRMGMDDPSLYWNTMEIADQCDAHLEVGQNYFPKYSRSLDSNEYLRDLAFDNMTAMGHTSQQYVERLQEELAVISKLEFSDYMLVIWDMVHFAHNKGILTGPGRGSVGGSLLAYVLGITKIDPIKHGLLFWRFLSAELTYAPKFRELTKIDETV